MECFRLVALSTYSKDVGTGTLENPTEVNETSRGASRNGVRTLVFAVGLLMGTYGLFDVVASRSVLKGIVWALITHLHEEGPTFVEELTSEEYAVAQVRSSTSGEGT
jgi:hypothetical protein